MNHLKLTLNPGKVAPRYDESVKELKCTAVVITEKGTEGDLPILDFQLEGPNGEKFYFCATGRLINMASAAVKGVNMRNHGIQEP